MTQGYIYLHPTDGFTFLENVPEKPTFTTNGFKDYQTANQAFTINLESYERALALAIEKRMVIGNPEVLVKEDINRVKFFMDHCILSQFKVGDLYPWPHEYDILESLPPKVLLVIPKAEPVNSSMSYSCSDCGAPMNEGEAKTFTCCDACWDKRYAAIKESAKSEPVVSQDQEELWADFGNRLTKDIDLSDPFGIHAAIDREKHNFTITRKPID